METYKEIETVLFDEVVSTVDFMVASCRRREKCFKAVPCPPPQYRYRLPAPYKVRFKPDPGLDSFADTYPKTKQVYIYVDEPAVFYHELAHCIEFNQNLIDLYRFTERVKAEVIAESVAYLIAKRYNYQGDKVFSLGYIQYHLGLIDTREVSLSQHALSIIGRILDVLKRAEELKI